MNHPHISVTATGKPGTGNLQSSTSLCHHTSTCTVVNHVHVESRSALQWPPNTPPTCIQTSSSHYHNGNTYYHMYNKRVPFSSMYTVQFCVSKTNGRPNSCSPVVSKYWVFSLIVTFIMWKSYLPGHPLTAAVLRTTIQKFIMDTIVTYIHEVRQYPVQIPVGCVTVFQGFCSLSSSQCCKRLFLLFQLMHTFTHSKNTNSH